MDFTLSDELEAVRDLAETILSEQSKPDHLAAIEAEGAWLDEATWRALADAGLLAAALPAEHGGSDLGWLAVHVLLEAVGRHAAKVPVLETLGLGALGLATFGPADVAGELLPRIAAGELVIAVALAEDGWADLDHPSTRATLVDGHWHVTGTKHLVALAPIADHLLVSAVDDHGEALVLLVDASTASITPQDVIGDVPHGDVILDGEPAILVGGNDALRWITARATAGVASIQAGLCTAAVRMSADYTSQREQFGRPIATFQAVSQRVADAHIDAEALRLTALEAAWRLSEGLPADEAVAIAKWWACEAGHRVLHAAHHVHGGVSVDRDYPLFRHTLRTKQLEHSFGTAPVHLGRLGATLSTESTAGSTTTS